MRFFLLLVLLMPAVTSAQSTPVFKTTGAFFALSVPDLDESKSWYTEKLGLAVTMQPPPYQGIRALVLEGGGLTVELVQNPSAQRRTTSEAALVHGFFKAGIVIDDYDATLARLRQRGVPIALGPFPAGNGQRANFAIRDNAGNLIQFFGR